MSLFSFDIVLSYDESSRLLCATLSPQFDASPLSSKHISAKLKASDYRDFYVYDSTIEELINQSEALAEKGQKLYKEYINRLKKISQADPIEAQAITTDADTEHSSAGTEDLNAAEVSLSPEKILELLGEQQTSFNIAECLDAIVTIDISDDALQAHLSIRRPYGGDKANEASIQSTLRDQGIEFGIDKDALLSALESEICSNVLIASGIEPTKGKDARFEPLVSEQISSAPKVDASGKVNYHDINEFVIVEPGDPLMRRTPPGKGKPGTDVFGKLIPSIPGELLPFSGDTIGSSVSDQDNNLLVASAKGHPVIKARGVSVENVLVLNNVGLSTGNVDFDGSVCVNQDVADGVKIEASGDVTVKGVVGKATIVAGGNIVILQGLLGGSKALQDPTEEPYGAHLTSQGSVSAHFATRSKIRAAKKIVIAEYSSHCDLYAEEKILVGQSGGKGNLFGGYCRAFKLVAAKVIGSHGGTPTHVQVGGEGDNIVKLRKINQQKRQNSEAIYDINEALHKISLLAKSAGMTRQMKEKVGQLNIKLEALKEAQNELAKDEDKVKKVLVKSKKSRVMANHKIFNNTSVSILGMTKKITEESTGGSFKFQARQVVFEK